MKKIFLLIFIVSLLFSQTHVKETFAIPAKDPPPKKEEPPEPPPPEEIPIPGEPGTPPPTQPPTPTPCIPELCTPLNNNWCCVSVGCVILGKSGKSSCILISPQPKPKQAKVAAKSFFSNFLDFLKFIF